MEGHQAEWRTKLPLLSGPIVAVGLLLAFLVGWLMPTPNGRMISYLVLVGLTVALLTSVLIIGLGKLQLVRLRLLAPPLLLLLSAASWLVLVESLMGKVAVLLAAALVVGSYQAHLLSPSQPSSGSTSTAEAQPAADQAGSADAGEAAALSVAAQPPENPEKPATTDAAAGWLSRRPGLPQAAFITDVLAVFFLTAFFFGLDSFYNLPLPLMAAISGLIWGMIAHENLWRFGVGRSDRQLLTGAFAAIGAEAHLGLAFLPIAYLAESMIAVIILAFGLHLSKQILEGTISARQFRNESLASAGLVALLLITAKWI